MKTKMSISISEETKTFIQSMVNSGRSRNFSHAIEQCVILEKNKVREA